MRTNIQWKRRLNYHHRIWMEDLSKIKKNSTFRNLSGVSHYGRDDDDDDDNNNNNNNNNYYYY